MIVEMMEQLSERAAELEVQVVALTAERDAAAAALAQREAECARMTEAMHRIKDWSDAYPPDVFTPLTDAEEKAAVDAMQAAVSNGSDRMHASWARHLMDGVGEIARAALSPIPAQRDGGDWSHLRLASAKMREEPEIARRLRTFMDYWGLDAYSPPPDVERNVRDMVHAFLLTLSPIPADPESDHG